MSVKNIHLRKALQLLYLPDSGRRALLRADIRSDLKKAQEIEDEGGGDFHSPFWADAKAHVGGNMNLLESVKQRIDANNRRERLYPRLAKGFLVWWNEKRRWRNEPFGLLPNGVKGQLPIPELDSLVKIENLLALKVGERSERIIYPYFSEEPTLPVEGRRIGIALLHKALPDHVLDDFRIFDILRASSYGNVDNPLEGNEYETFVKKYSNVLAEWERLKEEY